MYDLDELLKNNPALAKRNPGMGGKEPKKKKSKYRSKVTWAMGIPFASIYESQEVCTLELLLKAKEIKGYCMQPRFLLTEGTGAGNKAEEYLADVIVFLNDGTYEIIDFKAIETPVFKLKHKRFNNRFDLELKVVKEED